MKYIEWKSISDIDYTLWIDDGSATDTRIIGGPSPLVTETGDDEDIYTPVRLQTGNIQIAEDAVDLPAIIGKDPLSRKVTLFKSGEVYPVWKGYLQTQAFTQTWDTGPNIISLPVISALGALGARIPSGAVADVKYISFGQFIIDLVMVENTPDYRFFVFPVLSNPLVTLKYCFNLLNYGTWNEDERKYDMQSYLEILADICRTFGWTAVEKGDTLAFVTPDVEGDYIMMTYANLDLLVNGITPSYDTLTQSTVAQTVFGNDHTTTFMPGRRSVKVTGDVGKQDLTIYKMDLDQEFQGLPRQQGIVSGGQRYASINFNKQSNSIIQPRDSNINIKYEDAVRPLSSKREGCCIARERTYTVDGNGITNDSGWVDRIIFRYGELAQNTTLFTIYVPKRYFWTALQSGAQLLLTGKMKYTSDPYGEWIDFPKDLGTDSIELGIAIDNAGSMQTVTVKDGVFSNSTRIGGVNDAEEAFVLSPITNSGMMSIMFNVAYGPNSYLRSYYFSIEDLELKYSMPMWTPSYVKVPGENVEKEMIGNGFQEDLETGFGLTTKRTELNNPDARVPFPTLSWAQYGTGIILGANEVGTPGTLYDSKTPERALVERMKKYYGRSRQKLNVTVRGTSMLDPWMLHSVGTSGPYACISQSVNWRDEQINVSLYDITDEEES